MTDVTREELERRLGEVPLLDVRTPGEYDGSAGYPCDPRQGHIAGARHLDLAVLLERTPAEVRELVGLPEGAELVVYCHSGSRSAIAAEILARRRLRRAELHRLVARVVGRRGPARRALRRRRGPEGPRREHVRRRC